MGSGSASSPSKVLQKGWVDLAIDGVADFERKWVVLDNGVLWVYKDNADGSSVQVIPLHDAEFRMPQKSATTVEVLLGTPPGSLHLRFDATEEYCQWTTAMLETAQLWHSRRQMALMTVLDAASGRFVPAAGLEEGRLQVAHSLACLATHTTALRTQVRRAVTAVADLDEDTQPRFLRRAVADTIEKIWRACGRAHSRALGASRARVREECFNQLAVYEGVLLLRDAADSFVTYCSLLKELQAMLHSDDVALSPLRCMAALRDPVAALNSIVHPEILPNEEACQRAALAALDATLHRCWTELSSRPLDQNVGERRSQLPECSKTRSSGASFFGDSLGCGAGDGEDDGGAATQSPCTSLRLVSRLQRDLVRTSVRRARKRMRVEGMTLLPDQPLDDSLENALEMTDLACTTASSSPSSICSSGSSLSTGKDDPDKTLRPLPPTTPKGVSPPPVAERMAFSVGGEARAGVQRRRWAEPGRVQLRRRRLVCSVASCDDHKSNEGDSSCEINWWAPRAAPTTSVARDDVDGVEEVEDVEDVLAVLDVPVTPATPNGGGRRALWCETQEVKTSGLLDHLNTNDSALQEAKFEVLSSEESYLRSLDVLAHRVQTLDALQGPDLDAVTKFIDAARACSIRFVSALRALWTLDVLLRGLCTLMHKEALPARSLQQYVHVVSLQPRAASALVRLGSDGDAEATQLVPLLSLPAQRASRLPLLLAAILRRLDQRTSEAVICRAALDRLNQIVFECNEALRKAEQAEKMTEFGRILKAGKTLSRRLSWSERKNSVMGRAKSFFLKSNNRIGMKTNKILTSASSMLNLN